MRKILEYVFIFLGMVILFNLLLFFTSLFPSKMIEKNVKESSDILMQQQEKDSIIKDMGGFNENITDALMINEAYSIDHNNPIYSYMSGRKNFKRGLTTTILKDEIGNLITFNVEKGNVITNKTINYNTVGELYDFLNGKVTTSVCYARYWHGYLSVLRVLLLVFNISEIRFALYVVFTLLLFRLIYLLKKKLGKLITIMFVFSLITQKIFLLPISLESSPVFLVMMISCIILLKYFNRINILIYLFIIACITNFVDYLTVPLITLAMPLYLFLLLKEKEEEKFAIKDIVIFIIKSSIVWLAGYSLTWISKWVLYDMLYHQNVISSAISQILVRIGKSDFSLRNINLFMLMILMFILENLCYIFLFSFVYSISSQKYTLSFRRLKKYRKENTPFLLISIMPLIWYTVLNNHTLGHKDFVYRHMLIFVFGIFLCLRKTLEMKKNKGIFFQRG